MTTLSFFAVCGINRCLNASTSCAPATRSRYASSSFAPLNSRRVANGPSALRISPASFIRRRRRITCKLSPKTGLFDQASGATPNVLAR